MRAVLTAPVAPAGLTAPAPAVPAASAGLAAPAELAARAAQPATAAAAAPAAPAAQTGTRIMGVLNVTPDSFSDGGHYLSLDAAIAHGRRLIAEGAHIIDVGGESTRPGAARVTPEEEQRRVLPVIEALVAEGATVSIDTVRADTARRAVAAGATIINDVSGGTADPDMLRLAAESGAQIVLMHWRGIPDPSHARSHYVNVVEEVRAELAALAAAALRAGVAREQILLDPGFGFDKTAEQGWQLLAQLDRLASLGYPLLIGVSRKRMLAATLPARPLPGDGRAGLSAEQAARNIELAGHPVEQSSQPVEQAGGSVWQTERLDLTTSVVSAFAARVGAWGVRVHDAGATADAIAVARALEAAGAVPPHSTAAAAANAAGPAEAPAVPAVPAATALAPAAGPAFAAAGPPAPAAGPAAAVNQIGDRITLTGLEVFAHHGVFDFEREHGQRFVIDAELTVDLRSAASGDELVHTVNYAELAGAILEAAANNPVDLIETLAERLTAVALGFPAVQEARITVHKPDAPIDAQFADVSVTMVRRREAQ